MQMKKGDYMAEKDTELIKQGEQVLKGRGGKIKYTRLTSVGGSYSIINGVAHGTELSELDYLRSCHDRLWEYENAYCGEIKACASCGKQFETGKRRDEIYCPSCRKSGWGKLNYEKRKQYKTEWARKNGKKCKERENG